jgi:uncharacterized cofD-like protein
MNFLKKWWDGLRYEPNDPRLRAGGTINIVAIGGGTGLSTLLRGLKKYSNNITAIVAVTDDGASSGVIRKDFDTLPPGDIRKCISALAYDEEMVAKVLEHRFSKDRKSFGGHTLGNIWITALTEHFGSFEKAVEATTQIFKTAGRVLPATSEKIDLGGRFADGEVIMGESVMARKNKRIEEVFLSKPRVRANPEAILAIEKADLIIIGPGSLYTSVIPNLLISSIKVAIIRNRKAIKVFAANCSTERGETENYTIEDHIRVLQKHSSRKIVEYAIVNSKVMKQSINDSKLGEVNNITTKQKQFAGIKIILADVISKERPLYHDSEKLAEAIVRMYNNKKSK